MNLEPVNNVVPIREAKRVGVPNPVWDACVEALGYEPRTDSEKKLWGKMTTSLRHGAATPEEILDVAEFYHKKWPDVDLTITALEKWFSHFAAMRTKKIKARNRVICPHCDMAAPQHAADCRALTAGN
jgi:hypothetical protein